MLRQCKATLFLLLLILSGTLLAQTAPKLDVRVLVDVSGSMKKNDPQDLRRPALRLLTGLLPKGALAGYWIFDRQVDIVAPLQEVDDAWRAQAEQASQLIHSNGLFTHIEEALRRALADWFEPDAHFERHLILLTDGVVDVSHDPEDSVSSRQRILQELLPLLQRAGAHLHTIALSDRSDRSLMRSLSEQTQGQHLAIDRADDLQRHFLKLFEQAGKPETLPLTDNRFKVDAGIQEATLIVFRRSDSRPTNLYAPDGKPHSLEVHPATIRWHQDAGFEMITITTPQPGEWRIAADVDPDNRVMVVTDLKMHLSELPPRVLAGDRSELKVHFSNGGQGIMAETFLRAVKVNAALAEPGKPGEPQPFHSGGTQMGEFSLPLQMPAEPGEYELVVSGESETFHREKRHRFEVRKAMSMQGREAEDDRFHVEVVIDGQLLTDAKVEVVLKSEGQEQPQPVLPLRENAYEAVIDPAGYQGEGRIVVRVSGQYFGKQVTLQPQELILDGRKPAPPPPPSAPVSETKPKPAPVPTPAAEPVKEKAPEPQPKPEPKPEPEPEQSVGGILMFGAINLLLLLLGGVGYWWWRRGKQPVEEEELLLKPGNEDDQ